MLDDFEGCGGQFRMPHIQCDGRIVILVCGILKRSEAGSGQPVCGLLRVHLGCYYLWRRLGPASVSRNGVMRPGLCLCLDSSEMPIVSAALITRAGTRSTSVHLGDDMTTTSAINTTHKIDATSVQSCYMLCHRVGLAVLT
jgi:hypothetical protein